MSDEKIQREEVERVAALARLKLSPTELETMRTQLNAILGYVASLEQLDVTGVEPTSHAIVLDSPLRDDDVIDSLPREEALRAAPSVEAHAFAVPKVLEVET